jgi:regulation of enolase protein 1 (concanavalin A-like superfamily)
MSSVVSIPVLPAPLRAINEAEAWAVGPDSLTLRAGAKSDWFIDPAGEVVVENAPALVMPATGEWMLQASVSAAHEAAFDAAVLVVCAGEDTWAKLCLELSPQGQVLVVSVVTRGESDDCNSIAVESESMWFRISCLGSAFAFHFSSDGKRWDMVRYFGLGERDSTEVGFLAQSPTGDGCTATFRDIAFIPARLADVRSGI